jgi:hypothetical protein
MSPSHSCNSYPPGFTKEWYGRFLNAKQDGLKRTFMSAGQLSDELLQSLLDEAMGDLPPLPHFPPL